jgi:hypothetical protein
MDKVMNLLNTNEYDGQDKDIKPLLDKLKEQYRQVLTAKKLSRTRGGPLSAGNLDSATATSHETAVFGQVNDNEEKDKRRSKIIQQYDELIQNNTIQQLDFTTHKQYSERYKASLG